MARQGIKIYAVFDGKAIKAKEAKNKKKKIQRELDRKKAKMFKAQGKHSLAKKHLLRTFVLNNDLTDMIKGRKC